mmetsp:Transcript_72418/g.125550  ORF Transcript_72418/g.125550 Transcript_72418/m.125550 type:complete len:393 (+) Transcript_72418:18-1196(+)
MAAAVAQAAPASASPLGPAAGTPLLEAKKEEEGAAVPKKKKDEAAEESDSEESAEEDALLPEAEPTVPRNEVAEGTTKFREDAVHVYGLDFLKTGHMEEIFSQFNHRYIEWINDSSANVVFRDAKSAKKALESLSYPKAGDDPWRRTPDILVHDDLPAVYLQMRLAVASDKKESRKAVPSASVPYYGEQNMAPSLDRALPLGGPRRVDGAMPPPAAKKRKVKEVSEEEMLKRKRRAERFGESQEAEQPESSEGADAKAATTSTASRKAPAITPAEAPKTAEELEEEDAKRRKRALRFASAEESASPPAEEAKAASESAVATPAGDAEADAAKPAEEVAASEAEPTSQATATDAPSANGGLAAEDKATAKAPGDSTGSKAAADELSGEAGGDS